MAGVAGIVTSRRSNGFTLQDASPDGDVATAEGIFVFTASAPAVAIGDDVRVDGVAQEFRPACPPASCRQSDSAFDNLTISQIGGGGAPAAVQVVSSGNPTPAPVVIGAGGRRPPVAVIDDDANGSVETSGSFDPETDGIDFYESLEGMLVQVNDAVAVGPRRSTGEIPIVVDDGVGATSRTARGGVLARPNDFNPERIFLDDLYVATPSVDVGDRLPGATVGVMDYSFANYKLQVLALPGPVRVGLPRETALPAGPNELAVAAFNVENLAATDAPAKFASLATLIVTNLQSPDIVVLEEVQDNNGATNDTTVDATQSYTALIGAIQAAGGPIYQFRQVDPEDDQDGGQPGGNIRVGFLFRTDRGLAFVDRAGAGPRTATAVVRGTSGVELTNSPGRVDPTNPAFANSRKPLVGEFTYNGRTLFVIANHFVSKIGDDPLFGRFQPPIRETETQRRQQAQAVKTFVDAILALDAQARIVVLGDLNDFDFSDTLAILKGSVLTNLIETLPLDQRYTYVFEGNSQALDHTLVSNSLAGAVVGHDVVHVNAEYVVQVSDHDPQVARFFLPAGAGATPSPIQTSTPTATPSPTNTPSPTPSPTATRSSTMTPSPTPTAAATSTSTATPSATPVGAAPAAMALGTGRVQASEGPATVSFSVRRLLPGEASRGRLVYRAPGRDVRSVEILGLEVSGDTATIRGTCVDLIANRACTFVATVTDGSRGRPFGAGQDRFTLDVTGDVTGRWSSGGLLLNGAVRITTVPGLSWPVSGWGE
ncbi:MAG: endonuclease/exonuclease/phosphatase family protein [Chloroflexota bacterium]|nr:endonuclease/exonuclease/phosphatase family protein [Chloroflexota bacterium]